jgi:hypothetical protein
MAAILRAWVDKIMRKKSPGKRGKYLAHGLRHEITG